MQRIRSSIIKNESNQTQNQTQNQSKEKKWNELTNFTVTPKLLEEANNSFSYMYEFNNSYDSEPGTNKLSLQVRDSFLNSEKYESDFESQAAYQAVACSI